MAQRTTKIGPESVAVVTGAAHGIGHALCAGLAQRGAAVAMLDIDRAALDVVDLPRSLALTCDVTRADSTHDAARYVEAQLGAPSLLICNAGISVTGPIERLSVQDIDAALAVNFWGVVHSSQAFLPALRRTAHQRGHAAIAVVLSDFALISLPTKAAYAASKHAARAFTEALAGEVADANIAVSAIYPGATATEIVRRGRATDSRKQAAEAAFLRDGMAVEQVARRIIRAIERGDRRVLVGRDAHLFDLLSQLSPRAFNWMVRRFWRRVPFL